MLAPAVSGKIPTGGVCWTKFECFSSKIQMIKTNKMDSAGQTIFLGEWNCPASAFFPPAGGVWGGMRAGFGLGVFGNFATEFRASKTGAPPLISKL